MKRLTVKRVRAAYEKTRKYPVSGVFRKGERGRCPVSVVMEAETNRSTDRPGTSQTVIAHFLGVSTAYLKSFIDGFDLIHDYDPRRHTKYGYDDGVRVRSSVPPLHDY